MQLNKETLKTSTVITTQCHCQLSDSKDMEAKCALR